MARSNTPRSSTGSVKPDLISVEREKQRKLLEQQSVAKKQAPAGKKEYGPIRFYKYTPTKGKYAGTERATMGFPNIANPDNSYSSIKISPLAAIIIAEQYIKDEHEKARVIGLALAVQDYNGSDEE